MPEGETTEYAEHTEGAVASVDFVFSVVKNTPRDLARGGIYPFNYSLHL